MGVSFDPFETWNIRNILLFEIRKRELNTLCRLYRGTNKIIIYIQVDAINSVHLSRFLDHGI